MVEGRELRPPGVGEVPLIRGLGWGQRGVPGNDLISNIHLPKFL